jgi:hypothetical protein
MESLRIISENINIIATELYLFIVILDRVTVYIEREMGL